MFENPYPLPYSITEILISSVELRVTENYFYRIDRLLEDNSISFTDYKQFVRYNNVSWFDLFETKTLFSPSHKDLVVLFRE